MRCVLPLLVLSVVTCTPERPRVSARAEDVAVGDVAASPVPVSNANAPVESAASEGWVTIASEFGVERAPREKVIAAIRRAPIRVLVRAAAAFDECSGAGGKHQIFVVDDAWGDKPFEAAHIGGHGVWLGDRFPPGQLYVAGIRTHAPASFGEGWCLDEMPAVDASVIALLPVRDVAEGMHVIERLR